MDFNPLKSFLAGSGDAKVFVVERDDINKMDKFDIGVINSIVADVRFDRNSDVSVSAVDGGFRFARTPARERTVYEGDSPDGRVESAPMRDNPFRPRYRKLSDPELAHHDAIKTQASALLAFFDDVPGIVAANGIEYSGSQKGEIHANIKIAQRHLEDAVYRAVKALTS